VKRSITKSEFTFAINLSQKEKSTYFQRYRMPTMMKLQYHLIGRSDDVASFLLKAFKGHPDPRFFKLALVVKVQWSKNVMDERACPDQIFMGSSDPDFCLLLQLFVYLEDWMYYDNNGLESEFVALKTAMEANRGLRYKLRMMGVPIEGSSYVFCDN
jgi:hypothetical protein